MTTSINTIKTLQLRLEELLRSIQDRGPQSDLMAEYTRTHQALTILQG